MLRVTVRLDDDAYPSPKERERRAAAALLMVRTALGEPEGRPAPRLGELIALLVATDPDRRSQREAWAARREELEALRRGANSYVAALKHFAPIRAAICEFADVAAGERLVEAINAELSWRSEVEQQRRALPPETTDLWWPFLEGGTLGRPVTRRRVAEKAIGFGLEYAHIAMLESCLRVPLPEWPLRGELAPKDTLFLTPHARYPRADPLRDGRILERWRQVFRSALSSGCADSPDAPGARARAVGNATASRRAPSKDRPAALAPPAGRNSHRAGSNERKRGRSG